MRFFLSTLFMFLLSTEALAQSYFEKAKGLYSQVSDVAQEQIDKAVESGAAIPGALMSSIPASVREGYDDTLKVLGPQVENLSVWSLIGGSTEEAAYAVTRVPGMAWRTFRFSCNDEKKLDRHILCPAWSHYRGLRSVQAKVMSGAALAQSDIRMLVNMTLFLVETQNKVISKCMSNTRVQKCLGQSARAIIWNAITSKETTSLQEYASNMANGKALLESLQCLWPSAYENFMNTAQAPKACENG